MGGIHIDAVLEIPFYTILFDDGPRKQTNWEKLVPLADWDQKGKADFDSTTFQEKPRGNLRFRSWSRSRRLSWGVRDDEADDDKSTSSYRFLPEREIDLVTQELFVTPFRSLE